MNETSAHILVVDDDREIRDLTSRFLRKHGFRVYNAAICREMDSCLTAGNFDLIVLDLMMPGEDGLSICRRLRTESSVPIIMLTALGEETDRIVGLEVGADDYLPKPFNPRELLARIKAVLRRGSSGLDRVDHGESRISFNGWTIDVGKRDLKNPGGVLVALAREFQLPVHMIGVGEGADDLQAFRAEEFAHALVGIDYPAAE